MKKETKYSILLTTTLTLSLITLFALTKKYTSITLEHLLQTCQQMYASFFDSGVHLVGANILLIISFLTFILFSKVVFSIYKTRNKISLLVKQSVGTPEKVISICDKYGIDNKQIKIVHLEEKIALAYGLHSIRIIISTGLINSLSKNELESVILHEHYHASSKHPLILIYSEMISSAIFFLPFIKDVVKKARQDFEILADNFVITTQGTPIYLRSAIRKCTNIKKSPIEFYPSLASLRKNDGAVNKKRVILSLLSASVGIALLLIPTIDHVEAYRGESNEYCAGSCSVHCITQETYSKILPASFHKSS